MQVNSCCFFLQLMTREEMHAGVWWKRADEEELKHWQHQCFLVASLISCKEVHFLSRKMIAASGTQIGSDSSGNNPSVPLSPGLQCSRTIGLAFRTPGHAWISSLICPWFPELSGFFLNYFLLSYFCLNLFYLSYF